MKYSSQLFCFLSVLFLLVSCTNSSSPAKEDTRSDEQKELDITVQDGFKIEHLYSPGKNEQGSWVSMTNDGQGGLFTSDQYGNLYQVKVPPIGEPGEVEVTKLDVGIGCANGLLWYDNSLYVVVNMNEKRSIEGRSSGLYRITDSNGDGTLDDIQQLKKFEGSGEHGPHNIIPSPDGEYLYMIAGNHTDPVNFDKYWLPKNYAEDALFDAYKDPRGHANDRVAPGGWIARIKPDGTDWTLVSAGYRNPYDIAFNEDGELFTFDADMEWDMGMPWYRPIRVCHATSGSEFGWRTGSGKFPAYYPDNLPSVVDIGQGCPTGIFMGTDSKFPEKYQKGLFIFDWSFGTMYLVSMEPEGSSYIGEFEEFLSGVPLPLTDGVIGADGAMYFATGGRRLPSDLYRVTYVGSQSTEKVDGSNSQFAKQREIRRKLETYHKPDPRAVSFAQNYLDSEDKFIRNAARIAVEHQPIDSWIEKLENERNPQRLTQWIIAAARNGNEDHRKIIFKALQNLDVHAEYPEEAIDILRAHALSFIRLGSPKLLQKRRFQNKFSALYPSANHALNRELCRMLVYLDDTDVVDKTLAILDGDDAMVMQTAYLPGEVVERSEQYGPTIAKMMENLPPAHEIHLIESLSYATKGWNKDSRRRYHEWFHEALGADGGESYKGFLDNMRNQALENTPDKEVELLAEISGAMHKNSGNILENLPTAEGPGRNWTVSDYWGMHDELNAKGRNFENGKKMYQAALCASCHQIAGEGRNIGPDLTQISTRFSNRAIMEAILSPSREISDQYAYTMLKLADGGMVVGKILEEKDGKYRVSTNPYLPDQIEEVPKADVVSEELSAVSPMPAKLINSLNKEELMDLLAYMQAGGDAGHEVFE